MPINAAIARLSASVIARDPCRLVYSNLSEMIAAGVITQVGTDTVITLDADPVHHDQITLEDVMLASLTADHFRR